MDHTKLSPALAEFREFVVKTFSIQDIDSFWQCQEPFRKLLHNLDPVPIINALATRMRDEPDFEVESIDQKKLVLTFHDDFTVTLDDQPSTSSHLYSHPFLGMVGVLGVNPLHYDVYRLPQGWNNREFNPDLKLEFVESRTANPGEMLLLDGREFVYDFKVDRSTFLLKFFSNYLYSLEWAFYRSTLQPWQMLAADAVSSRQDYMVKVVRDLGNEASLPVLRKLTQSPHHYVRWSAIQAAAALDGEVGLELLREAANDPHPHIRDTARRIIAQAPVHQAS